MAPLKKGGIQENGLKSFKKDKSIMPLPKSNPRRIPRAMEAEPEALGNATWSENNINTNGPVIALASNINTWAKQTSDNLRFVRETGWMVYDFQTGPLAGPNCALFGIGLFWEPQIGLTQVTQGDIFYTNGKRVDLYTQQILNDIGQANHTFPPSTSVWVYASGRYLETPDQTGGQGTPFPLALPESVDLYFDDVGQGNPPNPPAGYTVVGGVLTNAIGIAFSAGPQQIPAPYTLQSGLAISLPFLFDGDLTVNGNLTVQGTTTLNSTLNVTGISTFDNDVFVPNDKITVKSLLVTSETNLFGNGEFLGSFLFGNGPITFDPPGPVTFNCPIVVNDLSTFNGVTNFLGAVNTGPGTLEVSGTLSMQSSAFMVDTFLNGPVSLTDTFTSQTNGRFVLVPKASPGAPIDGEVWVTPGSTSRLHFRNDNSITQQSWSSRSGLAAFRAGPTSLSVSQPEGLKLIDSSAVSAPSNVGALVIVKANIRVFSGGPFNVQVLAYRDATVMQTNTYRVQPVGGGITTGTIQGTFNYTAWINGPFTTIFLRADILGANAGDAATIADSSISVLGFVEADDIN